MEHAVEMIQDEFKRNVMASDRCFSIMYSRAAWPLRVRVQDIFYTLPKRELQLGKALADKQILEEAYREATK